jgi:hypothetical protein
MPLVNADVAAGLAIFLFGIVAGVILVFVIALIEAIVLRLLGWASFGRSLIDAFVMNLASTLVGLVLNVVAADAYQSCGYDPARGGRFCDFLISPWSLLVIAGLLSVLVEAGVLFLLRRRPARQTWLAALACNIASYALIGLLMVAGVAGI